MTDKVVDPLDSILDAYDQASAIGTATQSAAAVADINPDAAAETQRISKKFGYSPDVVERNLQEFQRREKLDDFDINGALEGDQVSLDWVSNKDNAALVSDDFSALARIKRSTSFFSDKAALVGKNALAGLLYRTNAGLWGQMEAIAALPGRNIISDYMRQNRQSLEKDAEEMTANPGASGAEQSFMSGVQSAAMMAPVMAFPVAASASLPVATARAVPLTYAGMVAGGTSAGEAMDKGNPAYIAAIYGASDAAVEVWTELNPVMRLISDTKVGAPFLKKLMGQAASEVPGEITATILQSFNEWAVLNNDQPLSSFLSTLPERTAQTVIATVTSVGLVTGAVHGISKLLPKADPAEVDAYLKKLNETSRTEKLLQRSPDAYHDFISKVAPDEVFYMNGDAALQALYTLPEDQMMALFTAMPNLRLELETASATGMDVTLTKADYATYIAPTPIAEALNPHMRLDPEGKTLADLEAEKTFAAENPDAAKAMQDVLNSVPDTLNEEQVGGMVERLVKKSLAAAGANEGEINTSSALFSAQARQYYRLFGDKWKTQFLNSLLEFQSEDETGMPVKAGSNFSVLMNDLEKTRSGKPLDNANDETRMAIEQFGQRLDEAGLSIEEARGLDSYSLVDRLFTAKKPTTIQVGDAAISVPQVEVTQTEEGDVSIQQAPNEEDLQRTKDTLNSYVQAQREVADAVKREAEAVRQDEQKVKEAAVIEKLLPETPSEEQNVKPKPVDPTKPIEDFGEKIEGAQKDLWKNYRKAMAEEIPADLKEVTLSKYFPEPDYEDMIARGVGAPELAIVKAMRDMVPAKPRNPVELRIWADKLKQYREMANDIINGTITADHLMNNLLSKGGYVSISLREKLQLYIDVGYPAFRSVKNWKVNRRAFTEYMGQKFEPAKAMYFFVAPDGKYSDPFEDRADMIVSLREAINAKAEEPKTAEVKFDIYQMTKTGEIIIGKKLGAGKFIDLKGGFTKAAEARAYLKENKDALAALLEKKREISPERRDKNEPRVGKDYRNGVRVTPEKFMAEFGFRGVQFGNYVEQAKRAADMDQSYDALLDMASIIGIPSRALSLNGTLGLAFGARGRGGKGAPAATYEASQTVINLTKSQGAGSLAHEWFHALDNYFGTQGVRKYATEGEANAAVRPEVRDAFENISKVLKKSGMYARSSLRDDLRTGKPYWTTRLEMGARAFEAFIVYKLNEGGYSNDFLVNIVDQDVNRVFNEMLGRPDDYPYPTREEMAEVAQAFETFLGLLKTEETEAGVKLYQPAYHGSPYHFERFDLSKIGTGEGAQAYGWGIYLAEEKNVADAYRQYLTETKPTYKIGGEEVEKTTLDAFEVMAFNIVARPEEYSLQALEDSGAGDAAIKKVEKLVKEYKKLGVEYSEKKDSGQLYKADVPDEDVSRMLDWDKRLDRQQPAVRKRLVDILSLVYESYQTPEGKTVFLDFGTEDDISGARVYEAMKSFYKGAKNASEALAKEGIVGIKYLDEHSRGKGEGTRNFVIFDQGVLDKINDSVNKLYQDKLKPLGEFRRKKSDDFMERMSEVFIVMKKDKNMSTLAHEFSHYAVAAHRAFVGTAKEMQLLGDGRKELQAFIDDWEALKNSVGATSDKFTEDQEEQIARWFEGYLLYGRAPSERLRPVFARFRAWMIDVFKRIRKIGVKEYMGLDLPKEAADTFDRWLASQQEIDSVMGRNDAIMEIVRKFNIDGLEDKITQYLGDAIQIAEERQYKKRLIEDKRRESQAYKNEYAKIREGVYAEKIRIPVYKALNWMKMNDVRFSEKYATKRLPGFNKRPPAWLSFEPLQARHWQTVEDIKALRDPTKIKKPKVESLVEFIIRRGGIQDVDGQLARVAGVGKLVNKKGTEAAKLNRSMSNAFGSASTNNNKKVGYSYERMMELVMEAGYFNRDLTGGAENQDYRDLFDLIEQEIDGKPVYRADDMDEVAAYNDTNRRLEWFDQILNQNGLDASRDSVVAILKRLEEVGFLEATVDFQDVENPYADAAEEPIFDTEDTLPQKDRELRRKITDDMVSEDGVDPDLIAERFGFASGESLMVTIGKSPTFEYVVDRETTARMNEKYPNFIDGERIRVEAIESLYNDKTLVSIDVLIREIGRSSGRTVTPGLRQFASAIAQRQVELTKMGDVNKVFRFEVARERELKEALAAAKAGQPEKAMLHLQRAMVAQLVFKRLNEFHKTRDRALELFAKVDKKDKDLAPARDMDFIGAARFILYKFGLGGESFKFQSWIDDVRGRNDSLIDDISQAVGLVSDSVSRKPSNELTVAEFMDIYNSIKNLYRVARQSKEIEKEGKRIKVKDIVTELVDKMGGPAGDANPATGLTRGEKIMRGVHSVKSSLRRVEHWCAAMDNGSTGPFTKYIWQPIAKAQGAYEAANDEWQSQYATLMKKYRHRFDIPGKIETQLIKTDEFGREVNVVFKNRDAMIGFLQHLGNESNMDKLLGGYGIDPDTLWPEIDRLEKAGVITKDDWRFCQEAGNIMAAIKPQVQAAHKDLYGFKFTEIEPTPMNRFGETFVGWYWPAPAEADMTTNVNSFRETFDKKSSGYIATTGRGFTKERKQGYREPLVTSALLGARHLEEVNRFIHIEPAIRIVNRVIGDSDFKAVLRTHDDGALDDMLLPWLDRVSKQELSTIDNTRRHNRVYKAIADFVRTSMTAQYIAYNIRVAAQDVANLSVVIHHVGGARLVKAFGEMMTTKGMVKNVRSMSAMMENRFNQKGERAVMLINQIAEQRGVFGKTKDFTRLHGNLFIQVVDGYLATVSWQAAFNKGIEADGMTDAEAAQFADRVVRDGFGSMTPADVSAFESNHPVMRILFPFMSYFNAQANVATTQLGTIIRTLGWKGTPKLIGASVSILLVPAVVGQLIVDSLSGRLPDDDEDGDWAWLKWLLESEASYVGSLAPLGSVVSSGVKALYSKPYDNRSSFNPVFGIMQTSKDAISKTAQVVKGESIDEAKYLRDLLTTIGFVSGLPLGQVAKPISYAVDVAQEEQKPKGVYDVLVGTVSGKQPKR